MAVVYLPKFLHSLPLGSTWKQQPLSRILVPRVLSACLLQTAVITCEWIRFFEGGGRFFFARYFRVHRFSTAVFSSLLVLNKRKTPKSFWILLKRKWHKYSYGMQQLMFSLHSKPVLVVFFEVCSEVQLLKKRQTKSTVVPHFWDFIHSRISGL